MNLLDDYSPIELLKRPHTIFDYEIRRIRWKPELPDLRRTDWATVWRAFRMIVLMIGVSMVANTIDRPTRLYLGAILFGTTLGIIFIGPWLVGVIADLYTISNTVTFWRTRAQQEALDLLRLTMPTDADLLNSLRAAVEVIAWRGMRWETALRAFLPFLGFIACGAVVLLLVGGLLARIEARNISMFAFGVCVIAWFVRMFILYLREPLWRMRTLVALSILITMRTRDTNSGILIASGLAMCLKLVQIVVLLVLVIGTLALLGTGRMEIVPIGWFAAGSICVPWLVRRAYRAVHDWCTRQTLRAMQGAAD